MLNPLIAAVAGRWLPLIRFATVQQPWRSSLWHHGAVVVAGMSPTHLALALAIGAQALCSSHLNDAGLKPVIVTLHTRAWGRTLKTWLLMETIPQDITIHA